jgi:hypothetical protein
MNILSADEELEDLSKAESAVELKEQERKAIVTQLTAEADGMFSLFSAGSVNHALLPLTYKP